MGYFNNQRVHLDLQWPFGSTLLLSLIVFIVMAALIEGIAQSDLVQSNVPFQAYGVNHIQFEMQVANLEDFVAQYGEPNCIILGNSQSLRGIDPEVLVQTIKRQSGTDLLCYNFSIVGTNIATTLLFSEMLVDRYELKLIILGTSFLDYTMEQEYRWDQRFMQNEWLAYQLGEWSLRGWMLEHSYAFRLITYFSYGAPDGFKFDNVEKDLQKWNEQLTPYGYGRSTKVENLAETIKLGDLRNFMGQFDDYKLSALNLESLEKIIQLAQQRDIQIVIVEMPYHPSLVVLPGVNGAPHPEQERLDEFITQVDASLREIADHYQVPYLTTEGLDNLPKNGWHDRYHLNVKGSIRFSRWLARQLAKTVKGE